MYKLCVIEDLTCKHQSCSVSDRNHNQANYVRGKAHQSHPGVLQTALHDPQPCQASEVGYMLGRRAITNQLWTPAERSAQLIQHIEVIGAEMYRHHQKEAKSVQPQFSSASLRFIRCIEAADGLVVPGGEELCLRVRGDCFRHKKVCVKGCCKICGQYEPEWVDIPGGKHSMFFFPFLILKYYILCMKSWQIPLCPSPLSSNDARKHASQSQTSL